MNDRVPHSWPTIVLAEAAQPIPVRDQTEQRPVLTFKGLHADGSMHLDKPSLGRFAEAMVGDTVFTKQGHAPGWIAKKVGYLNASAGHLHVASTLQVLRPAASVNSHWLVTVQVLGVSFVTVGAAGSTLGTCLLRR